MICIRAPKRVLPAVNLFVFEHRLMVIAADVNSSHDSLSDDAGDRVTWYVTPLDPEAAPADDVPDTAQAEVEAERVVDGVNKLLKVFPSLRAKAELLDSGMEFAVYAGYKQGIGEEGGRPLCRRMEGLSNVIVALPSLVLGASVNARKALELVGGALEPGKRYALVPGAGEGVQIGEVTENTDQVTWMTWNELLQAYPGIRG